MKHRNLPGALLIFSTLAAMVGCSESNSEKKVSTQLVETEAKDDQPPLVFNFSNKTELAEYGSLNPDETHDNLQNPQISKADYEKVVQSWTDLHQKIGSHLSKNNFEWDTADSTISIVHKIYFQPSGEIKYHFFKILTPDVSKENSEEFSSLLSSFAGDYKMNLTRETSFAQCGKARYSK
jgi:hypothetical protein